MWKLLPARTAAAAAAVFDFDFVMLCLISLMPKVFLAIVEQLELRGFGYEFFRFRFGLAWPASSFPLNAFPGYTGRFSLGSYRCIN